MDSCVIIIIIIQTAMAELRDEFIESADDDAEREQFARLWPYQDVYK
jgi:hypothetical protein